MQSSIALVIALSASSGYLALSTARSAKAASPLVSALAVDSVETPKLLNTAMSTTPTTGKTINVAAGGNLQGALDSAAPGDRITLACGSSFVGNFILRAKAGNGWI